MDPINDRATEIRSTLSQQLNPISHSLSLVVSQRHPPVLELIGDLDFPHPTSMSYGSS
jgi:hypothetical protein